MKNSSLGFRPFLLAALTFSLATAAQAQIIFDDFTGTNGTALSSHTPNVNQTGNPWVSTATFVAEIQNDSALMNSFANAAINIASSGGYTKPTQLTVSADINLNNIVQGAGRPWDGVGLGYFSTQSTSQSFFNFTGILIKTDGSLQLIQFDTNYNANIVNSAAYAGTWNQAAFHSLSYTVDTITGGISGISFDGMTAPYSGFATTLFTDPNTNNVGVYLQNNVFGTTAMFDNFSLTTVPEPTTLGLLLGAGALIWVRRRRA